ncbi:MAG TPA: hypothetical protein VKX45_13750 [Bryobacteraceae bacterium]|nr:hypothetical protein [Bryobacteraceae bacterium]
MDLNLDTLKQEILDYLAASGFALFRSSPGALDGFPMVIWDTEHYPDYQMFLDVASKCGAKVILFASREFDSTDIEEIESQLEDADLSREEQREYESRLRDFRSYLGQTCSIELAFDHNQRFYVYEVQPDWFGEYIDLEDEISARFSDDGEMDEDDSLGGFFSKN